MAEKIWTDSREGGVRRVGVKESEGEIQREREMERGSMWSEKQETDRRRRPKLRPKHSLGQMLHEEPQDLSIFLGQFVHQAVDCLDARLWTPALC